MFLCNPVATEKLPILLILLLLSLAAMLSPEWNSRSSRKVSGSLLSWEVIGHHIPPLKLIQLSAHKLVVTVPMSQTPTRNEKKVGGKTIHSFIHSFLVNTAQRQILAPGRRCFHSSLTRTGVGCPVFLKQLTLSWSFKTQLCEKRKSER